MWRFEDASYAYLFQHMSHWPQLVSMRWSTWHITQFQQAVSYEETAWVSFSSSPLSFLCPSLSDCKPKGRVCLISLIPAVAFVATDLYIALRSVPAAEHSITTTTDQPINQSANECTRSSRSQVGIPQLSSTLLHPDFHTRKLESKTPTTMNCSVSWRWQELPQFFWSLLVWPLPNTDVPSMGWVGERVTPQGQNEALTLLGRAEGHQ